MMARRVSPELEVARFWSKVDRSGGPSACWPFTGARNKYGYGHVRWGGKVERAHRVAIILGDPDDVERPGGRIPPREIPEGMYGLHNCDNRPCCNPGCLRVGTPAENNKDEYIRYRRPAGALAVAAAVAANVARARKRRSA